MYRRMEIEMHSVAAMGSSDSQGTTGDEVQDLKHGVQVKVERTRAG